MSQVTIRVEAFASVSAATLQQYQTCGTLGSVSIDELASAQHEWVTQLQEQYPGDDVVGPFLPPCSPYPPPLCGHHCSICPCP